MPLGRHLILRHICRESLNRQPPHTNYSVDWCATVPTSRNLSHPAQASGYFIEIAAIRSVLPGIEEVTS